MKRVNKLPSPRLQGRRFLRRLRPELIDPLQNNPRRKNPHNLNWRNALDSRFRGRALTNRGGRVNPHGPATEKPSSGGGGRLENASFLSGIDGSDNIPETAPAQVANPCAVAASYEQSQARGAA